MLFGEVGEEVCLAEDAMLIDKIGNKETKLIRSINS